ncbi:tetratricopeptide repeat protein [Ancylothrix sp. C2]|uniref:tetratricopeptide repeat protein n=1 Tax=Ancylothrix sp. D3o TaxID=2953691 RepID=UPI0021BB2C25|nr:tetratricopeptide repeat protein [Ancylothrix sp. D3o]MCT7948738.1 tetratricopeptide repeat protein [Ancylothrix sp. D3o]
MANNNPDFDIEAELEQLRQQLKPETPKIESFEPQNQTPQTPAKKANNSRPKLLITALILGGLFGTGILTFFKSQEASALSQSKTLIASAEKVKNISDIQTLKNTQQFLKQNITNLEKIPNLPGFAYQQAQTNLPELRSSLNILEQNTQALETLKAAEKLAMEAAVLVQNPPHPPEIWQQAQQKWQQAITLLQTIPSMNPWEPQAQNKLANYRSNFAIISKRVELSKKALDFNNRGIEAVIKGDTERSLKYLNLAIRLNPIPEAYAGRGFVYLSRREYPQAIKEYDQAIKLNPNYADAYLSRGLSYHKLGNSQQAIQDIDRVLQINPNHGRAYLDRAVLRHQIKLVSQAETDAQKAAQIFTETGDTNNLKLAQNLLNQWGVALTPLPAETSNKDEEKEKECEEWQWQSNYPLLPCYFPEIEIKRRRKRYYYPQPTVVQNDPNKTSASSSNNSSRSSRRRKKR